MELQIGAPYKAIGLISESKSMIRALNDSLDLIILRFKPKNALIALVFSMHSAVLSSPEL